MSTPRDHSTTFAKSLLDKSRRCCSVATSVRRARAVMAAQQRIRPSLRDRQALAHVLRKVRVIRRRERQSLRGAIARRGHAERSLGCDVNGVGRELVEPGGEPLPGHSASRISGYVGHGMVRCSRGENTVTAWPSASSAPRRAPQRRDDTVDLRQPSIRDDRELHSTSPKS